MKTSQEPKLYFCPFLGHSISGVVARGCNYCNLEDNTCNHTEGDCVAKEGLELFAQSLTSCIPLSFPVVLPAPSNDLAIAHHNLRKFS